MNRLPKTTDGLKRRLSRRQHIKDLLWEYGHGEVENIDDGKNAKLESYL
jgi:hypothetical protein